MTKETKRIAKKLTALLLSIIMMLSGLVSVLAFDDRGHEQPANEVLFENNAMISEARQKYYELLGGNYWSVELPDRFRELFGDISPEYILHNYTTIFDISSEEMDQAVLRVLTQGAETLEREREERWLDELEWFEEWEMLLDLELEETPMAPLPQVVPFSDDAYYDMAAEADLNTLENYENAPLNTAEVHIEFVSATNTSITLNLFFNPRHNVNNNTLRYYDFTAHNPPFNGTWVDLLGRPVGRPTIQSGIHTITGLTPGATYRFLASVWDLSVDGWVDHEIMAKTTGGGTHSLQIANRTQNSLTVNVTFPVERESGNRLRFFNGSNWVDFVSSPTGNLTSGSYTISGLSPGITYRVLSQHMNRIDGEWSPQNTMNAILPMPSERLVRFTPNAPVNMIFYLDQEIVNVMGSRVNAFVNATNRGYAINHDLVGGALPFNGTSMELRNTRSLPHPIEGTSGQPIYWQVTGIPGVSFSAIDHAHAMNRLNANTAEMPFHEIAHNFDSHRWSFCLETMAIFMTYHYYDITNERKATAGQSQVWVGGSGFRTYMRSHANRIGDRWTNYDATIAQGRFGYYGLAWNLANIQTQIGWEPFRQTFRHFHTLAPQQVPARDIDKFNYFLSRLQDYSGRNVFAMFNANERTVYQAHFGGTMGYVNPAPQNITLTFNSNNRGITPNPAPLTRTPGTAMGNMPSQPVWANHRFLGWFDTSGPTGGNQLTSTARVPDRNTTYYARWEATVTFDAAGGILSGNSTINAVVGSRITLPTPLPPINWGSSDGIMEFDDIHEQYDTRSMILFTGWRMQNGDSIIEPTMEVRESTRLVAGWNFPVDANLSDGIYRIRRPNGTHLNAVSSNGNISFTLNTHINNSTGADLWYIESTGDGRHYTIESIGIRGPNLGASPYVLSARSIIDQQLTLTASSGSIAQQWRIMRQGADLFFINRAFPNTRINVTDGTVAISNNQSGSEWRLEEYTRKSSFGNAGIGYTQFSPHSPIAVDIGITPTAIRLNLGLNMEVYNAGLAWNGISDNVNITINQIPQTRPVSTSTFNVDVVGYDWSQYPPDTQFLGQFLPDGYSGIGPIVENMPWSFGELRMCNGTHSNSLYALATSGEDGILDRQKVFVHEVGHALRLHHPHDMHLLNHEFSEGWWPVSVMNLRFPRNEPQSSVLPRGYDKFNLISRWGQ